jgi:hypothetical protein
MPSSGEIAWQSRLAEVVEGEGGDVYDGRQTGYMINKNKAAGIEIWYDVACETHIGAACSMEDGAEWCEGRSRYT